MTVQIRWIQVQWDESTRTQNVLNQNSSLYDDRDCWETQFQKEISTLQDAHQQNPDIEIAFAEYFSAKSNFQNLQAPSVNNLRFTLWSTN